MILTASSKIRRFARLDFLERIARQDLQQFIDLFKPGLKPGILIPPGDWLDDEGFYRSVSSLVRSADAIPPEMSETISAIEEMATPQGQARIESALAGTPIQFRPNSTHAEIALQACLHAPERFARAYSQERLTRVSKFEYFGPLHPVDRRDAFRPPAPETIERMQHGMDSWFGLHNRGHETTQIQVHQMSTEYWFTISHGDTFTRTATVERRTKSLIQYRPAKDDVVVYCPERDEIRIHAGTKGERQMYRRVFGEHLFGDTDYFSQPKLYTLEPLREDGARALVVNGIPGLTGVFLQEIEILILKGFAPARTVIHKARDLLARGEKLEDGRITRAVFEVYFAGSRLKPRRVEVMPPNTLKLGRYCDAWPIEHWLSQNGFIRPQTTAAEKAGIE